MENGQLKSIGDIRDIVDEYMKVNTGQMGEVLFPDKIQEQYRELKFKSLKILNDDTKITPIIDINDKFTVEIEYELTVPIKSAQIVFELINSIGVCVFSTSDVDNNPENLRTIRYPGRYRAKCTISPEYLRPGSYYIDLSSSVPNVKILNILRNAISFEISGLNIESKLSQVRRGIIVPIYTWETQKIDEYRQQ